MKQETGAENGELRAEPRAPDESQQYPIEKHKPRAWEITGNVVGVVMGVPVSLLALAALSVWPMALLVGIPLVLIAVGLFIPSRLYEHGRTRAIGFVALSLATAMTAFSAVVSGYGAIGYLSDPADDYAMLGVAFATMGAMACVFALSCTSVLLLKLRPKLAHAGIGIAAGIAVALLIVLLWSTPT